MFRRVLIALVLIAAVLIDVTGVAAQNGTDEAPQEVTYTIKEFDVPRNAHPHDVAPAPDGTVWYTAQADEALGLLDPGTGETRHIHLGSGSSPHGVIVGPDGAPWITDSGLNAIVRVDPETDEVKVYKLPDSHPARTSIPPCSIRTVFCGSQDRMVCTASSILTRATCRYGMRRVDVARMGSPLRPMV